MHFDLTDLRLFIHIAESPSLTQGAKRAFISPAAASTRIKTLEETLKTKLLYRDAKGTTLTDAGKRLLVHARQIIQQTECLKNEFASLGKELSGNVRIFANTTAVTELLPNILSHFLSQNPKVSIDLQEKASQDIYRGVADSAADIGVTSGPVLNRQITIIPFAQDRLVLVIPLDHPLQGTSCISLKDSLIYPHIGLQNNSSLLGFLRNQLALIGRDLPMRIQVSNFEAACRMIESGVGIGVVPESAANRYQKNMKISIVSLSEQWSIRQRQVLIRNTKNLPANVRLLANSILKNGNIEVNPIE